MRHTPRYLITDPEEVRRLIRAHPWATFVSPVDGGVVASHYPVILEDDRPRSADRGNDRTDDAGIVILSHFGRPDDRLHQLGEHQVLVIIQGPHDYVSPSWYSPGEVVPTWDHVTAHLYGTPQILSDEENYAALSRLTDHFERHRPHGRSLGENEAGTRRAARGTVGLRMRVDRFDARAKLSQDKAPDVVVNITAHLDAHNPALAAEMRRTHRAAGPDGGG